MEAELGVVEQLGVGARRRQPVSLDRRSLDERAAVRLDIDERIDDHDRDLMPQSRAALSVAVEEKVRHSAD